MQGINRTRHTHLVDALLRMENMFSAIEHNEATVVHLKAKRVDLENSHRAYLEMLDALAFHITAYEDLFAYIKVRCVGNRLKELKKHSAR